jgi:hypothetical protein
LATRRLLAIVLVAAAAVLGAACGEAKLDTARVEDQIGETLAKRTGVGIDSVECPGEVEAKKGDSFRCTATTEREEQIVVNVRQDDDEGAVTWNVARKAPGSGG